MSDSTPPVRRGAWRFFDLRKAALFTFVASSIGATIPMWNAIRALTAAGGLALILGAISLLTTLTMLVFLFALSQNHGTLNISRRLRLLALTVAVIVTSMICWSLPRWVGVIDPAPIYYFSTLLAEISGVGQVLLLVALFRNEEGAGQTGIPVSTFLKIATKATVIVWGVWLVLNMIRGLMAPFAYMQIRDYAARTGRPAPAAIDVVGGLFMEILNVTVSLTVPYIVFRAIAASRTHQAAVLRDLDEPSPMPDDGVTP